MIPYFVCQALAKRGNAPDSPIYYLVYQPNVPETPVIPFVPNPGMLIEIGGQNYPVALCLWRHPQGTLAIYLEPVQFSKLDDLTEALQIRLDEGWDFLSGEAADTFKGVRTSFPVTP